jgi:hypothetical protein
MTSYTNDRAWSDKFIKHMKHIIGPRLLDVASFEVDTKQATDLIVFKAGSVDIAARVRKHEYFARYPHEFTLRAARPSGVPTELEKILDGWGDWMFYGYATEAASMRVPPPDVKYLVQHWMILQLDTFRYYWQYEQAGKRCSRRLNNDGTQFLAFDVRTMPGIVLDSNHINIDRALSLF